MELSVGALPQKAGLLGPSHTGGKAVSGSHVGKGAGVCNALLPVGRGEGQIILIAQILGSPGHTSSQVASGGQIDRGGLPFSPERIQPLQGHDGRGPVGLGLGFKEKLPSVQGRGLLAGLQDPEPGHIVHRGVGPVPLPHVQEGLL